MLTHRQKVVLDYIRDYAEQGHSPSYGEIASGVHISRGHAHEMVKKLVERGHLTRGGEGSHRSLRVVIPRKPVVTYTNAVYFKWDEESQGLKPWHPRKV